MENNKTKPVHKKSTNKIVSEAELIKKLKLVELATATREDIQRSLHAK